MGARSCRWRAVASSGSTPSSTQSCCRSSGSPAIDRRSHPAHVPEVPHQTTGGPMLSAPPIINRWRAFALLAVSYFMTIIDLTIVNVSLPTIGRDLHFSQTSLQWVVTAYALTFGGFLLLGGPAADLLGRRRILTLGLAV